MSIEIWDVLDENGALTGKTALRGKGVLKSGEYHLVVHIWIVSSTGMFLIQRRADDKKLMPGEWAATGGAAISGEDSFAAAKRELFEELGIKSDEKSLSNQKEKLHFGCVDNHKQSPCRQTYPPAGGGSGRYVDNLRKITSNDRKRRVSQLRQGIFRQRF